MSQPPRPDFIRHWTEMEGPAKPNYSGSDELFSNNAPMARLMGLTRIGIHHERLLPGRRTSYPHAESTEEEFAYVIDGHPDVWIDGWLHRLSPGDGVGFPAPTGICHSFLNNTDAPVRLLVLGETPRADNKIVYPLNLERKPLREDWWHDWPARPLGPHDGKPDPTTVAAARGAARPDFIRNWQGSEDPADHYPGDPEEMGIGMPYSDHFGMTRIGVHHIRLLPGRRTCYPHAESLEEEFVFMVAGEADAWIDGHLHRVKAGDAIAFPAGTGISHCFINNGQAEARMITIGQRDVPGNRLFYPLNPEMKTRHPRFWHDAPKRTLGPHNGRAKG